MNKPALAFSLLVLGVLVYPMKPSYYKTDMGNGITVYADAYVNSGEWVYHCEKIYRVSRTPRLFPVQHFLENARLSTGPIWLSPEQSRNALALIQTLTQTPDWYIPLRYASSGLMGA